MTKRGKLLLIINHMDWFWSHRLPLAEGARDAGWDVVVAGTGAGSDPRLAACGFKGRELPAGDRGFIPVAALDIVQAVYRLSREEKPDIVHAITIKYVFLAGLALQLTRRIRMIHTIAGLGYLFSGQSWKPSLLRFLVAPFLQLVLKHPRADVIFQNSDDMARLTGRGYVRPGRAHLIPGSGVDTGTFTPRPEPETDRPLVLMPTRLVHDKGISVFVKAAEIVQKQGIQARFAIAGGLVTSNPQAVTQAEMDDFCASGTVDWLGKITDMPGLLGESALVAFPSWYREGLPKVLLEAAACGRAIVTTDHPGCREAVRHEENGLLVPVKDAQALAEAITRLLENRAERTRMGQAGRRMAEDTFDARKIVSETLKLYES